MKLTVTYRTVVSQITLGCLKSEAEEEPVYTGLLFFRLLASNFLVSALRD
jgi:hypothetical protein